MINPPFFLVFLRDRRSPRPPPQRRNGSTGSPGLVLLQAEPGRLDAFPGRLVEGAHHAGLVPLVPLVVFWGDELPLGDGDVNGWEIWVFGTLLFAFFWGELEDFR